MAHVKQSRPDSGLGLQVEVLTLFCVAPSLLGSGCLNTLVDEATWKMDFKIPWREASSPNHLNDPVDSDH
jgi:hypothetical protein